MQEVWSRTLNAIRSDPTYKGMFAWMESQYGPDTAAEIKNANGDIVTRSYSEYANLARQACGRLERTQTFAPGQLVGLAYDNCPDWPVLLWGILMSGGIPLLLNPAMDARSLCRIMEEAHAAAYVSANPIEGASAVYLSAKEMLSGGDDGNEVWADYVALCTSGTTGSSRIFLYHSETIVNHMLSFDEAKQHNEDMPFIEGMPCKLLAFLPFYHVFGFSVIYLLYSCIGRTIVYLRDKSIPTVLEACRSHGVTHLYCVPMFFNALAAGVLRQVPSTTGLPEHARKKIQSSLLGTQIRVMITGGGHVTASTLKTLNDIGYPLYNGFGMTECGIISVEQSSDPNKRAKGSIGIPFSLTEYKIEPEGIGELFIRGGALYTASMIDGQIVPRDKDAWFATGDLVRADSDGLYIAGRTKDVIINASGENIYPDELEERFLGIPGIARFSILGVRSGAYEKVAMAFESAPDAEEDSLIGAISKINDTLSQNERLQLLFRADTSLPISSSMKIKRQELKKTLEEGAIGYTERYLDEAGEKSSIKDTVRKIISDELFVDSAKLGDTDHFVRDLGGDSLTIYSAITEMEKKFGIVLSDADILHMTCVDDCVAKIYAVRHGLTDVSTSAASREEAQETKRITDFRESGEYSALHARMDETFGDGFNPYFLPHDSLIRDTSVIGGKRVINLGSYNYLGMSGNPETEEAAIEAIRKYGTSASGSRTLAGEKTLYQQLEQTIADWKHTEDCIVCTGGWATNLTFISTFAREGDFILYDALSHNSIAEGVALSKAESKAFPHNDLATLERLLSMIEGKYNKVLIVVEGVYSMDGDIAPIPEFVRLKKKYSCFLMVDEAHSGGVIGEHAGGVDDYFGLEPHDIDIKYGTLSKALGTCGGYIAADHSIVEYLRYSMNGFVFTAGIAPPLAAACMKAIEIIRRDNSAVTQLHRNIEYFVRRCKEEGMNTCLAKESAIVPVLIGSDADAARMSALLMERGVFVPPAMYPAVPRGESRLRFTISATHSIEQLETAVTELAKLMREEGFLQ